MISLNLETLHKLDLSHLAHFMAWNPTYQKYFLEQPGKEPYKLLAYLASQIQGDIYDLGTLYGSSALALSFNERNNVLTLDNKKQIPEMQGNITILNRPNIKFLVVSAQAILPRISTSQLVYVDFDTVNTNELHKVVNELMHYQFKGILVVNDILLNDSMKTFWNNVPTSLKKIDVTAFGHFTGTGIIVFHPQTIDVMIS